MSRRPRLLIALLGALTAAPLLLSGTGCEARATPSATPSAPLPPRVTVAAVELREVPTRFSFVGRVEPVAEVDLRARVEGFVERVEFEEGRSVDAGDPLYQIERAPYRARLGAARAQRAKVAAQLAEAKLAVAREQALVRANAGSREAIELAQRDREVFEADLKAANAAIAVARLELDYTTIKAPISGRLGRTRFTEGNLVSQASGPLARLVQLDPIRVAYSVTDRDRLRAWGDLKPSSLRELESSFVPQIRLANGERYPHAGRIEFTDNQVDAATGSITVWATFENPEHLLLPGNLVEVESKTTRTRRLAVIPERALVREAKGPYVWVVGDDDVAHRRPVVVAEDAGGGVALESGLEPGERVVVTGQPRVRDGATVTVEADR